MKYMIVAKDGSGEYTSIQQAINSINHLINSEVVIYIKEGVYKEKLFIDKPNVTLIGKDSENTIITYDDYALKLFENGEKYRTFNSYSVFVGGDNFKAENITFQNTAGDGRTVGQTVAAYVDGDRAVFKNCRFLSCQDTLFTGPLPPNPIEGNTFGGPREGMARRNARQYYEGCYIEGDIDFIFGSATAVFNKCEIFSRNRDEDINGYITAASTPEGNEFGYVFIDCKLTSNCKSATVYLGRPWRDYAKTVFINCYIGEHIIEEGWHNWNKTAAEKLTYYGEFGSYGPGANLNERVKWTNRLSEEEVKQYSINNILGGNDEWKPNES